MNNIESNMNDNRYLGQVKWFDNKLGYGFITVLTGDHSGTDIFVHQTNVGSILPKFTYQEHYD